jgi:hypothetical protein
MCHGGNMALAEAMFWLVVVVPFYRRHGPGGGHVGGQFAKLGIVRVRPFGPERSEPFFADREASPPREIFLEAVGGFARALGAIGEDDAFGDQFIDVGADVARRAGVAAREARRERPLRRGGHDGETPPSVGHADECEDESHLAIGERRHEHRLEESIGDADEAFFELNVGHGTIPEAE